MAQRLFVVLPARRPRLAEMAMGERQWVQSVNAVCRFITFSQAAENL